MGGRDDGADRPLGLALRRPWVDRARLAVSGAGAAMVLYLVYVELFRIGAICLWCTAMHVTAVLSLRGRPGGPGADPERMTLAPSPG